MANLTIQNFTQYVQMQATAIQGRAAQILDFTIGSVLRALVEANASVLLWLQGLILQVLALTRAATSTGPDLDTWVGDYDLTRLGSVAATGMVTFSRFTPSVAAVVPIGALVQTADGTQQFTVTLDGSLLAYSASQGGYVLSAGTASINVPVQAVTAGVAGNVVAGAISQIGSAVPGVDTVTNNVIFTDGLDPETDTALRTRFLLYIQSLSKATPISVGAAVQSVQQGLYWYTVENEDYQGNVLPGYFYVVLDDGSGAPPSSLIDTVAYAIDTVRPIGVNFDVFPPVLIQASVAMTITTTAGYTHATIVGQVGTALTQYINSLSLGQTLPFTRLAQVAYDTSIAVTNVTAVTLNGTTADLAATPKNIIRAFTIVVV